MLTHLACIMDGNRRWAAQRGWNRIGKDGIDAAYRTVDFCLKKKIPYLSLFAFSLENFKRSPTEINYLFDLMVTEISIRRASIIERNIKVRFIGDVSRFSEKIKQSTFSLESETAAGSALHLDIMLCYGGRQEIVDVTLQLAHDIQCGKIKPTDVDLTVFERYLWTAGTPDPELIIRTGGAQRLSNFLLYQGAYAELYFCNRLWPALQEEDLQQAYDYFNQCKRNFGK